MIRYILFFLGLAMEKCFVSETMKRIMDLLFKMKVKYCVIRYIFCFLDLLFKMFC